jgi:erythromycin esterase
MPNLKNFLTASFYLLLPFLCTAQGLLKNTAPFLHPFPNPEAKVLNDFIKEIATDKRIIGLGEVSHYTKDCYDLKAAIIYTLIDQGYDGLALEVDFGQALIWNDYVVHGQGNLDTIVAQSGWFTYRTEEFKTLLQRIRAHNIESTTPFQIFGMEMTALNHNLSWMKNYLAEILANDAPILARLSQERKIVAFENFDALERQDYWNLFFELKATLGSNQQKLIAKKGTQNFAIAERITEITRQFATYIAQDDYGLKGEFRDQFSARNIIWCLNQLGEESQLVIWAHNGHVAKQSIVFNYDVLGHYLEQWFGADYYSIGFNWNSGEFGAYSSEGFKRWRFEPVSTPSLSKDFGALGANYVLLDVRNFLAKDKDPAHFLRRPVSVRRDMSESYNEGRPKMMEINLSQTFDAYIYIHEAQFPTTISWIR